MSMHDRPSLVFFCESCSKPIAVDPMLETALRFIAFYECHHCHTRHRNLTALIDYSAETREYI